MERESFKLLGRSGLSVVPSLWSEREVFDEDTSMMLLVSLVITRSSTLSRRVPQSTICDRKFLERKSRSRSHDAALSAPRDIAYGIDFQSMLGKLKSPVV